MAENLNLLDKKTFREGELFGWKKILDKTTLERFHASLPGNIEEIEYKQNRLVMFLNTPFSIHGVSKRSKTVFYRKYVNIIGEFNFELFNFRNFLEK